MNPCRDPLWWLLWLIIGGILIYAAVCSLWWATS